MRGAQGRISVVSGRVGAGQRRGTCAPRFSCWASARRARAPPPVPAGSARGLPCSLRAPRAVRGDVWVCVCGGRGVGCCRAGRPPRVPYTARRAPSIPPDPPRPRIPRASPAPPGRGSREAALLSAEWAWPGRSSRTRTDTRPAWPAGSSSALRGPHLFRTSRGNSLWRENLVKRSEAASFLKIFL